MKTQILFLVSKSKPFAITIAALAALSTGCSINIQHEALNAPSMTRSGPVNVADRAVGSENMPDGADGRVGWGRITLFAIPVVPIHVDGDANALLPGEIQAALSKAGYSPQPVTEGTPGKVLTCRVDKFGFSNYTYLFPLVPTWGNVQLNLSLTGPDKAVLWNHSYRAGGATLNFFNGYTSSCDQAMTQILDEMVTDFAGQDFYAALNK